MKKIITAQLAALYGVHSDSVRNWVKAGWITPLNPKERYRKDWEFDLTKTIASLMFHAHTGRWGADPFQELTIKDKEEVLNTLEKLMKKKSTHHTK